MGSVVVMDLVGLVVTLAVILGVIVLAERSRW
jgi:hypothetical protein